MNDSLARQFDIGAFLKTFALSSDGAPQRTQVEAVTMDGQAIPKFTNEFWTARQRQAASLHEVAYRACFKPQLPRFFIERLSAPGDVVYDPFSGRGTTMIEAALLGRTVVANDINPLSRILSLPRLHIPDLDQLAERLARISLNPRARADLDLSMFYHPATLSEIVSLRRYLLKRKADRAEDELDAWIRMIATNRLTGHSSGFFSVYTLPPNQAVSAESQIKINQKRQQTTPYRDTRALILKKSRQLVNGLSAQEIANLKRVAPRARFYNTDARRTRQIADASVQLTVTSPPFLDIVQYAQDNWLRCWFNDIDAPAIAEKMTMAKDVHEWSAVMQRVFSELYRITRRGGWVAFEVGEVRKGKIRLDEYVVPLGLQAGFACEGILVNQQEFTKTANIWGIRNNAGGTNTNRVVIFFKE